MIKESGIIVSTHPEQDAVTIAVERASACGSCKARAGCQHGLTDMFSSKQQVKRRNLITVPANQSTATIGQAVEIGVPEQGLVLASLTAYLVPLLSMLLAMLASYLITVNEGLIIFSSFVGLFAGLVLARMIGRQLSRRKCFMPQLIQN